MLHVNNLTYRIKNRTIIQDVSFSVSAGETLAILGQNGAGKTTLIKLLSSQIRPEEGRIFWKGSKLDTYTVENLAKSRSVLTQQPTMAYDFLVPEVVMMGRYPHFKGVPKLADTRVTETAMLKTDTTELAERFILRLSGGEQQRVHFARVLAQVYGNHETTRLLLLDEPLKNLDVRYQHHMLRLARDFANQGNVVVTVLHDVHLAAMYADTVLLLKHGKVHSYGSRDEVLTEPVLSSCYDVPAHVEKHPVHGYPMVFFDPPVFDNNEIPKPLENRIQQLSESEYNDA